MQNTSAFISLSPKPFGVKKTLENLIKTVDFQEKYRNTLDTQF